MATIQLTGVLPTSNRPGAFYIPMPTPKNQAVNLAYSVAVVGHFSRGLPDAPQWVAQPSSGLSADMFRQFGAVTPHPTTAGVNLDGMMSLLAVANQNVANKLAVRIGASTMATGYVTLNDAAAASILSLHAGSPGTWSNGKLSYTTTAGTGNAWNLTVTNSDTGESEVFTALPGGSAANILTAIATINARSSDLVRASLPTIAAPAAPTATTTGSDGTLTAVPHYVQIAWVTAAGGESLPSPELTATPSATNHMVITSAALPTGVTAFKAYIAIKKGGEQYVATGATSATSVTITGLPAAGSALPMYGQVVPNTPASTRMGATLTVGTSSTWVVNPATGTFPATSPATGQGVGNDGADAPTSRYTGWLSSPNIGATTLLSVTPAPNFVVYAEAAAADTAEWLVQAQNAQVGNWCAVVCLPQGTAPGAAPALITAQVGTLGAYGDFIKVAWNWARVTDPYGSGAIMNTSPAPYLAAITAAQSWERAAFNKPLGGIVGIEQGAIDSQLQAIITANGNSLISNIPAGAGLYGFDNDRTISGMDAFEMRAKAYFAAAIGTATGVFVGDLNAPGVRILAHDIVTSIFDNEARQGKLPSNPANTATAPATTVTPTTQTARGTTNPGVLPTQQAATGSTSISQPLAYVVICDTSNNVNAGTGQAAPVLYITVMAAIFSNIRQVWTQSQIGQTVVVSLIPFPTS